MAKLAKRKAPLIGPSGFNILIIVLVAIPPLCTTYMLRAGAMSKLDSSRGVWNALCRMYMDNPIVLINLLFLVHVDITFYMVSLSQARLLTSQVPWVLARPLGCDRQATRPHLVTTAPLLRRSKLWATI
jgi:hypothetical protein